MTKDQEYKYLGNLLVVGFVTGSTRWGCNTIGSDLDIVILDERYKYLKNLYDPIKPNEISPMNETYANDNSVWKSEKITLGGILVNFIIVTELGLKIWQETTELMDKYVKINDSTSIANKDIRISVFHAFQQVVKSKYSVELDKIKNLTVAAQ